MNYLLKLFILACSIFSLVGILIIINNVRHDPIQLPYNLALEVTGFLFWYLQPILGLILIFISKKRKIKYWGIFFFALWFFAFLTYIFRP